MLKIWTCKIGEVDTALLPDGSDRPMRHAARVAYVELTGREPNFCFSGWGGSLTEPERAAHENREPSEEHRRKWHLEAAAPDMKEALRELLIAVKYGGIVALGSNPDNPGYTPKIPAAFVEAAERALAKAEGR